MNLASYRLMIRISSMRQIPILSDFFNYMTAPRLPRTSLSISETHLALVTLKRSGADFEPRNLGVSRLPAELVRASFTEPNVADELALIDRLAKTASRAGMGNIKSLNVSLPSGSARSMVAALDAAPASRAELEQMIEWKTERGMGQKFGDLRVNYTRLRDLGGRPQYLISATTERVIAQYERIFGRLGWQAGMIAPQHIGEAQWLMRQGLEDDQVVVSLNERGFDAVIVRGQEPLMVREVECAPEERENEFYRLMVFYRDRLALEGADRPLNRALMIGSSPEQRRFHSVLASAMERPVVALDLRQIGLRVDPNAPFSHFAAAGGLATMAWN
jgi:Tfp pilus assembly PilM family ATPase